MIARPEDERSFYVSRAGDCGYVPGPPELLSSRRNPGRARLESDAVQEIARSGHRRFGVLPSCDPPRRKRYRVLISRAFTARRARSLEPEVLEGRWGSQRLLVECDGFSLTTPTEGFRDMVLYRGLQEPRIRTGHGAAHD